MQGKQRFDIRQQFTLLPDGAVSFDVRHPIPGDGNGAFAVGQRYHQQLVPETDLCPVYEQIHFLSSLRLSAQPLPGDRFIPFLDLDRWVVQQPTQSPGVTEQFGPSGNLPSNLAQMDCPALEYPNPHSAPHDSGFWEYRVILGNGPRDTL